MAFFVGPAFEVPDPVIGVYSSSALGIFRLNQAVITVIGEMIDSRSVIAYRNNISVAVISNLCDKAVFRRHADYSAIAVVGI